MSFATSPDLAQRCAEMRRPCPWCKRPLRPCNLKRHVAKHHFVQLTIDDALREPRV
jgi:hypothetical protein